MKSYKFIYILLIFFFGVFSFANAQQKIDPLLEVSRDFDGKLLEIHKSKLNTSINDSLTKFNLDFNYSIFKKPYRDMYEFNPMPSLQIEQNIYPESTKLYLKASAGYPFNPKGEIYYQPNISKGKNTNDILVFGANVNAFISDINLQGFNNNENKFYISDNKIKANNSEWGLSSYYSHIWEKGILSTAIKYNGLRNLFYGYNDSFSQDKSYDYNTTNAIGFEFNIQSVDAKTKGSKFNYNFNIDFQHSGSIFKGLEKYNISENIINIKGYMGPTFGKYNRFLIGFESNTVAYSKFTNKYIGLFSVTPQYKFDKGRFILEVGANISFAYSDLDKSNYYHNSVMPNINFSLELAKDYLWFYASAVGNNKINDYYSMLEKNRWVLPSSDMKTSSTPFVISGGLRGKSTDKLSYNLFLGYQRNNGMLQFVTDINGKYFTPAYSSNNQFFVGAQANVQTKSFHAGAEIQYNSYSNGKNAINIPDGNKPLGYSPVEGKIYAGYNYIQRMYVDLNLRFNNSSDQLIMSGNSGNNYITKLSGYANLSLTLKYRLNNNIMLFIEGENLLNERIQYQPFYLNYGIGILGGITLKL